MLSQNQPRQCQEQGVCRLRHGAGDTTCMTACALQTCLARNTYNAERCDEYVRKLYLCCFEMYAVQGSESTACPKQSVVERWLKQGRS